jgi:hypothetical protein
VKFLATALALHVMSRAQLRELMALFVVGSTLTLAVFFLALLLLPFETFNPSSFPRFPGVFLISGRVGAARSQKTLADRPSSKN